VNGTHREVGDLIRRLARVRTSSITVGVLSAILLSLVILGVSWLAVSLLDMGLGLASGALRVVSVFLLVFALAVLAHRLVRVFRVSHSIRTYAARVGARLKDVGLDLLTALDLSEVDSTRLGYSPVLITRVIDDIATRLKGFDLEVSVRRRSLVTYSLPLFVLAAASAVLLRYDGPRLSYSVGRLAYFLGLSKESRIEIAVEPGDDEILAGEDLTIGARITGFVRQTPSLHVVSDGEEKAFTMDAVDSLETPGARYFRSVLARVDRDITYFLSLGSEKTPIYLVSVTEEPRVKSGRLTLTYPAYTGRGRETLATGIWDINAPYGTNLQMDLETNCLPESVWVVLSDTTGGSTEAPVAVSGDSLHFERALRKDFDYSLELLSADGTRAKPHGPHEVRVSMDEYPYVRIESPGEEIMLEADMIIPLSVLALDDYGISKMHLVYESPVDSAAVALPYEGKTQAVSEYMWDLNGLDLFPGDVVTYYVSVADNDALRGPKYARTEAYIARVPTVYELYSEIENEQDENLDALEEIAQEAEDLKDESDHLIEDMKRNPEITWEEEQAIKQNVAHQDEIRQKAEDVASSLDETLDLMGQNSLVSFEVIEKMEEIRQLLEEVATEDMVEAMKKVRDALDKLSPEEIREAMENLSLTQEDLLRRLDRTIEMLKQLQAQQRMESVLDLANQITEGQREINQSLSEGGELGESEKKEKGLIEDAQNLEEMMKDLAELLKEQGNPLGSDIDKAGEFMQASQIPQSMSQAASSMSGGDRDESLEHGQNAEKNLSQLSAMLQSARDSMMGEERRQVMEALTKAMNGLRDVSKRQEGVLGRIESGDEEKAGSELARMEMVYKEALDRIAADLFEVSKKSLFVSPMLGRAVLKIGSKLADASDLLAQGKPDKASTDATASLGAMNEMIAGLMDAMDKASSCSSPSGMCDAFQSLECMCASQAGINQGTQQMLSEGMEGLSMEARAQMARLAAEQEAVKKGIEDLAREYGSRGEILGRLDDLVDEARQVVEDLKSRNVSGETVQRQERILTRLLNAQKSMRRRDYTKRRKSEPAKEYEAKSPAELSLEEREELVRDMLYGKRGYYPPEYEELIRAYFKALSRAEGSR
jgi:DNA-binding transcriptional regulator YiaG